MSNEGIEPSMVKMVDDLTSRVADKIAYRRPAHERQRALAGGEDCNF
jgi:hypothetical protein